MIKWLLSRLYPPKMGHIADMTPTLCYLKRLGRDKEPHKYISFYGHAISKAKERKVLMLPGKVA